MFKLFHKKLNKKGFTLAELLVVVAILAILVAIAIPIFYGEIKNAQRRVNEANIRAVRATATTTILTNWNTFSAGETYGWVALETGNISDLKIFNNKNTGAITKTGIIAGTSTTSPTNDNVKAPDDTDADNKDEFNTIAPSYTVQVVLTDLSTAETAATW